MAEPTGRSNPAANGRAEIPPPNPLVAAQLRLPAPLALYTLALTSHGLSACDRLAAWSRERWGIAPRSPSPSFDERVEWADQVLGLRGDARREWARRAWWGHAATQVVTAKLVPGGEHRAESLVDPVDWRRVDELHAAGRGLLVVASHLGDEWMLRYLLTRRYPDVSCVVGTGAGAPPSLSNRLFRTLTSDDHVNVLASARACLKRGGVVVLAADGKVGERARDVQILGRSLKLQPGTARLARLTRSPCLPVVGAWHGRRVRLVFGEPIEPREAPGPEWEDEWLRLYVCWLERWVKGDPENVRINGSLGRLRVPRSRRPPSA